MRLYNIAMAALAIGAPLKWIDNTISQHAVNDVRSTRRGVARRVSFAALLRLALIRQLHVALGASVRDSVRLANELLETGTRGVHTSGQIQIIADLAELERELNRRLADALESAPAPKRGRPRSKM